MLLASKQANKVIYTLVVESHRMERERDAEVSEGASGVGAFPNGLVKIPYSPHHSGQIPLPPELVHDFFFISFPSNDREKPTASSLSADGFGLVAGPNFKPSDVNSMKL